MNKVLIAKENWRRRLRDRFPLLQVKCPQCGVWGDIIDHVVTLQLNEIGHVNFAIVDPSVICGEECGFHALIALQDYHEEISENESEE